MLKTIESVNMTCTSMLMITGHLMLISFLQSAIENNIYPDNKLFKDNTNMSQIVGVDVGGTFTDLISFDTNSDTVSIAKVLSTPENQAFGVMKALETAEANLQSV